MKQGNRLIEFDIMRIVACFCVIMIHAPVFNQADAFDTSSFGFQTLIFAFVSGGRIIWLFHKKREMGNNLHEVIT